MSSLQYRYSEFRYDGDRTISGVVLDYSDAAQLDKKGSLERFEPRAFGDLENEDIILNFQHDRKVPIARTGGGGLTVHDDGARVTLTATLPNTRAADDALELIKSKVMRGFSVEFMPTKQRWKDKTRFVSKAQLKNIAIVDRPAYPLSTINPRSEIEDQIMDRHEIEALIKETLEARSEKELNVRSVARDLSKTIEEAIEKNIDTQVREQIQTALEERGKMEMEKKEMEEENMEMKEKAEKDKKMREMEMDEERKKMEMEAEDRAELISNVRPLLAEDFETRGKSKHEILIAAVGDVVQEPEKRSEDYLQAKVETILENRESSAEQQRAQKSGARPGGNRGMSINRSNVIDLLNTKRG